MTAPTTPTFDPTKLTGITLSTGHHNIGTEHVGCAMNAIAWATTGEITDMPECVHPLLARKVQAINDGTQTTDADRWHIVTAGGPILVGSDQWAILRVCFVIAVAGRTAAGFVAALEQAQSADLSSADLSYANLRYADLSSANLRSANLRYANLSSADLRYADLRSANLSSADLRYADLSYANLRSANLRSAVWDTNTIWPDGFTPPTVVTTTKGEIL